MRRRNRKKARKAPRYTSKADKCVTPYCRNQRAKKSDGYFLKHCWKCRSRQLKEKHPVTYILNMLRHSARKRKLPFTITKAEFAKFCADTGYIARRGNKPDSLTIDRKDANLGYHIDNLQVLRHAANSAQGADNTKREDRGCEQAVDEPDWVVDTAKNGSSVDDNEPF